MNSMRGGGEGKECIACVEEEEGREGVNSKTTTAIQLEGEVFRHETDG